jgi:hypothetical protein
MLSLIVSGEDGIGEGESACYWRPSALIIFIGQSSLTLALLRTIITEGSVSYDGILTDSINLDALRSNITIVPQMVGRHAVRIVLYHLNRETAGASL